MKLMKKMIAALTLTGLLAASLGLSAFADDAANVATLTEQQVTKHLVMAESLDVPDAEFSFAVTAVTADAPAVTIGSISYSSADDKGTLSTEGVYTVDKSADITFGTFPHAGTYEYTVTETTGSAEGITYDSTSYTMTVYVANGSDGALAVQRIIVEADNGKQYELSFTNTYCKNGSLTITKNTEGDLADKTKDFAFTITFIKSGTESDSVTSYTGKIGEEPIECTIGQETSFYLHDGESLVFDDLPVGTRYVVTEVAAADGYTPSVSVIENGVQTVTNNTTAEANALSTANAGFSNLVGEKENSVVFTNTCGDAPATGLVLKNLPFLLLIVLPALALILPVAAKSRMKKRNH